MIGPPVSHVLTVVAQTVTSDLTTELVIEAVTRIVGFGLLAGGTAACAALVYRWYSAERIPDGVAVLTGVAVVAAWLNTRSALGDAIIGGTSSLLDPVTAVYTVAAFAVSAIAADGGHRVGDYLARDVFAHTAPRTVDEMTQLVRAAGRVVSVELPETIEDADGYDPISDETRADLEGKTLSFPRRLSVDELRSRLIARLADDYGVGHVDVDLREDGTIESLALGRRPSGLGPTLPSGQVAVAIRADPAADASPGDAIEVWRSLSDPSEGSPTRVTTAELRAAIDDVTTIAIAPDDVEDLEPDGPYRLVTLPSSSDASREFVSVLRASTETVSTITVDGDTGLVGAAAGSLPVTVLALERDGQEISLPDADERLEDGDLVYLLGRPDEVRRVRSE